MHWKIICNPVKIVFMTLGPNQITNAAHVDEQTAALCWTYCGKHFMSGGWRPLWFRKVADYELSMF